MTAQFWNGWQYIATASYCWHNRALKLSDDMAAIAGTLGCVTRHSGRVESRP